MNTFDNKYRKVKSFQNNTKISFNYDLCLFTLLKKYRMSSYAGAVRQVKCRQYFKKFDTQYIIINVKLRYKALLSLNYVFMRSMRIFYSLRIYQFIMKSHNFFAA